MGRQARSGQQFADRSRRRPADNHQPDPRISGLVDGEVLIRHVFIGDLNLDGAVSISDFIDLASNFGQSLSGEAVALDDSHSQLVASRQSALPEPVSLAMLALAPVVLSRRQRFLATRSRTR